MDKKELVIQDIENITSNLCNIGYLSVIEFNDGKIEYHISNNYNGWFDIYIQHRDNDCSLIELVKNLLTLQPENFRFIFWDNVEKSDSDIHKLRKKYNLYYGLSLLYKRKDGRSYCISGCSKKENDTSFTNGFRSIKDKLIEVINNV